MALSLGNMIGIALRLLQHRGQIERLAPQIAATIDKAMQIAPQLQAILAEATRLTPEVQMLAQTIAPELFGPLRAKAPEAPVYDVRWVQTSLRQLGHDPGPIDGIMGQRTKSAIEAFQQAHGGLVVDGWAGIATTAALDEALRARA